MTEPILSTQCGSYLVEVRYDEDYEIENDYDGVFLVGFHRQFWVETRSISSPEDAKEVKGHKRFPLYAYIHGGVALSLAPFSCRWDSGQVGFVFVREDASCSEEEYIKVAQAFVEDWNNALSGRVYRYAIFDAQGDVIDSCGGYVGGEVELILDEAVGVAKSLDRSNRLQMELM